MEKVARSYDQLSNDEIETIIKELKLKKKPIPNPINTIQEVVYTGKRYEDKEERFNFYYFYLTGQRATEGLVNRRWDIRLKNIEGQEFFVVDSITRKNRQTLRRSIPIPLFKEAPEYEMSNFVFNRINELRDHQAIFSHIGQGLVSENNKKILESARKRLHYYIGKNTLSKIQALNPQTRRWLTIDLKLYPHYLRHCRATHFVVYHDYNLYELMQVMGWSDPKIATVYAVLNAEPLGKKMVRSSFNAR